MNEYAFFKCKAELENQNIIEKSEKLDAVYGMSRDLLGCNFLILFVVVISLVMENIDSRIAGITLIYLIISTVILGRKAVRYLKMRVRTIFRQYINANFSDN